MLCGMIDVIISKGGHCVVAVVIVWLEPDVDAFLLADFLGCRDEVLW
jgi:hypothetical protein